MPPEAALLAAQLTAELCLERLRPPGVLGVFAERLPPLDRGAFVAALAGRAGRPIRVAILGGGPWTDAVPTDVDLTVDATQANTWRHDAEARQGRPCVTLVVGQVAKINSLRTSVPIVHATDLRLAAASRAVDALPTPERRVFWDAAALDPAISNTALLEFAAAVIALAPRGQAAILEREPHLLHLAGLLPEPELLSARGPTAIKRLLERNREAVARIRRLTDADRRRAAAVARDGQLGVALRAEAEVLLRFGRGGPVTDLGRLSYANVVKILRDRPPPALPAAPAAAEEPDVPGPQRPTRTERVFGDELAVDMLLNNQERGLEAVARRYDEAVQPGNDEDVADEFQSGPRTIARRLRNGQAALENPLARLVTAEVWGGLVHTPGAVDAVAAIQAMDADDAQVVGFRPTDRDQVREMLGRAAERGIVSADAIACWSEYTTARTALLPSLAALADHPLMAFAADADLRARAERVIAAHAAFLQAARDAATAMRARNSFEPAKRLLARTLCLDLVVVRSQEGLAAIAAPTHPFHLWRWLALERLMRDHGDELRDIGDDVVRQLVLDPPPIGPNVLLSPHVSELELEQEIVFVGVGSLGALPVFGDPQSRTTGRFRADALTSVASNLVRVAGHARFGLKVALIDPPSLPDIVEALLAVPARNGEAIPLHVDVFRTKPEPTLSEEEHVQLEGVLAGLDETRGTLRVQRERMTVSEIVQLLAADAAHLAIVFEPGHGRIYPVGVDAPPALSPLVAPRVYQYDEFDDRFTVVVAAEATTFGPYYQVFREAMSLPQNQFFGRHSGSTDWRSDLERLAQHALWTVIVDQGLEPTFHLAGAMRLDWRSAGGRDLVTFTTHPGTVEDFAAQIVERGGLVPNDPTVERTLAGMRALGGDTVLMPIGGSNGAPIDPKIAKGLLGTLAAARTIALRYAGGVVVSLDDRHSRRWILGAQADDGRRGDLLWIRPVDGGIVVTAVEVKAHDDSDGTIATTQGRATGRAVDQIDSTIRVLRRILVPAPASALDRARREILQDQLYRAVASRQMEPGDRERSVQILQELFREGPTAFDGALFKVRVASGSPIVLPTQPRHSYRTKEDNPLALYEVVEAEEGEVTPPSPPPSPPPPAGDPPPPSAGSTSARASATVAPAAPEPRSKAERAPEPPPTPVQVPASAVRILLGHSADGREIYWDPTSTERPLMNFGMLVTGDSGSGKTQTLRAIIDGVVSAGLPVCIFDFKNDYADPAFSGPLGLTVYDVNRDGLPFNPLALVADEHGEVQPIRQVHEVGSILKRIFGLGDQQEARLKRAIAAAFEGRGIAPRDRHKVADLPIGPSFTEVVALLDADDGNETLLNRLSPLFDLNLFPSAEAASAGFEDLLADRAVLDLHSLPDDRIKAALAELIIVRLHGHLVRGAQPRALRRLLVFDEAWRVKDSKRLEELAREGRAFGVGIAVSTQYPRDVPETLSGSLETQIFLYNREAEHQRATVRALCGATSGPVATQLFAKVAVLQKHQGFVKNSQHSPYLLVNFLPHYARSASTEGSP